VRMRFSTCCTCRARLFMPRRISVGPLASHTRPPPPPARQHQRLSRTSSTRPSAEPSTPASTITRRSFESTISIRPGDDATAGASSIAGLADNDAASTSTAGRRDGWSGTADDPRSPCRRRHVKSTLVFNPCRRATSDTDAPASKLSETIRRRSSIVRRRRTGRAFGASSVIKQVSIQNKWTPILLNTSHSRQAAFGGGVLPIERSNPLLPSEDRLFADTVRLGHHRDRTPIGLSKYRHEQLVLEARLGYLHAATLSSNPSSENRGQIILIRHT
jgi:hypothetical protein